ncbi:MAG: serine/threonine protein kinase [Planctomycetes bacterium]|nr:serine/threonine protein kinase [Planctomycetota bacterium]
MPDQGPSAPDPNGSFAARLRQRYGADIDPRVDLDTVVQGAAPPSPPGPTPSAPPTGSSSSTLKRLEDRGNSAARYRLQGELARGGMGAILEVYDEDLRRRLAMKVILDRHATGGSTTAGSGVDPLVLSRFLEEAQVTGQLDHPGIVPVHELGIDEQGRVYFTMRLVHGRDLEAICGLVARGAEDWTTTRVLGVLLKVCEAMAYAHEKGVVHRDLKPQNVMVGRFGEVYVMDWGLARVRNGTDRHDLRIRGDGEAAPATRMPPVATDRRDASTDGGGDGLYTMDGDIVGTPSYMSPEQARGDLAAIDERSDVYSVGAMLYRLLAGTSPYAAEQHGASAVWRRVMEGPPPPLESLAPHTPPELVAVCTKAMQREPAARYAGMLELGADLRAFLEGRVVTAFETGAIAEARKWIGRNRGLAASLAAALVALVAGLVGSLVFADRAQDSARIAEQRRLEAAASATLAAQRQQEATASAEAAQRQARIAQEVNAFLNDDLLASIAPEHQGKDVTVRQVLDQASMRLELVGLDSDPAVEVALRLTIGTSYERLGEHGVARGHFERALQLAREHLGARSEPVLQAMRSLAAALAALGRLDEAIATYREAVPLARELLGPEHRGTMATVGDLATALATAGKFDEARALRDEVMPVEARVLGEDDENTLVARNNRALLDQRNGRLADAERSFRELLARRREVSGPRHPETLVVMNNLALVLGDLGRLDEGEQLVGEVLDAYREIYDEDHPKVANAVGNVATFAFRRGRMAAAEQGFREALRLRLLRSPPDSPEVLTAKHNLATSITDPRRRGQVLALREEILAGRRRALGAEHPDTLEAMNGMAATLRELERLDEAEALYRETLAARREILGEDHPDTLVTTENLGGVLLAKKDAAGAEAMTRDALERRRRVLGDGHPDVAKTTLNLAIVQRARGDDAAALATAEDALARSRAAFGASHQQVAQCLRTIGDLHTDGKQFAPALAAYREALEVRRRLGPDDGMVGYLLHQTAYVQLQTGELDGALQHATEAATVREALSGADGSGTRVSHYLRCRVLLAQERHEQAAALAHDLFERAQRLDGADAESTRKLRALLASIYDGWNKPEDAAKWR